MILVKAQINGQPRALFVHSSPAVRIYQKQRMLHSFWNVKRNGGTAVYCCDEYYVLCKGYLLLPLEKRQGTKDVTLLSLLEIGKQKWNSSLVADWLVCQLPPVSEYKFLVWLHVSYNSFKSRIPWASATSVTVPSLTHLWNRGQNWKIITVCRIALSVLECKMIPSLLLDVGIKHNVSLKELIFICISGKKTGPQAHTEELYAEGVWKQCPPEEEMGHVPKAERVGQIYQEGSTPSSQSDTSTISFSWKILGQFKK